MFFSWSAFKTPLQQLIYEAHMPTKWFQGAQNKMVIIFTYSPFENIKNRLIRCKDKTLQEHPQSVY